VAIEGLEGVFYGRGQPGHVRAPAAPRHAGEGRRESTNTRDSGGQRMPSEGTGGITRLIGLDARISSGRLSARGGRGSNQSRGWRREMRLDWSQQCTSRATGGQKSRTEETPCRRGHAGSGPHTYSWQK
jgi:hypothetical protein